MKHPRCRKHSIRSKVSNNGSGTLQQQAGYTLTEIIITIAILAIAVALAGPPLQSFIENNRMTTSANKLVSAINLARNEAISRRATTRITGNDAGWTVSIVPLTTTTLTPIASYNLDQGVTIDISDDSIADNGITFSPDGYRDLSGAPASFNFVVCDPDTTHNRTVNVSAAGTTKVSKGTGGCP